MTASEEGMKKRQRSVEGFTAGKDTDQNEFPQVKEGFVFSYWWQRQNR